MISELNKMDDHLKELLNSHRNKFALLDADRFVSSLGNNNLLSSDDIDTIRRTASPSQKVLSILDLLITKGPQGFQSLCIALENTSPHLLTIMLTAASQRMQYCFSRQGSITAGLTSDSECDDKKSSTSSVAGGDGPPQSGGGGGKTISTSSPQPQSNLVSSHDYNMEQSNVKLLKAELKIVTKDRDVMKKELKKVTRDRDEALHRLDQSSTYGTLTKHGNMPTSSDKNVALTRELENLKLQYDKAIIDIQTLRKQNMEYSRKYDSTVKDVDYYRKQERTAYTSMQNLRLQYEEVVAEKQKLENEVTSLQTIMEEDRKEIAELRRQQQDAMTQDESGESINQLYITTLRKFEVLQDEYDSVRKRYAEVSSSHANNHVKMEFAQEASRYKKQYEEVVREKNCLKQQCTEAIRQWDTSLREKNKLQEEILKTREKNDELGKEMNGHIIQNQNLSKELKRLQSERNAAMQEYTLVMSERDTVHKEMDKLQEELSLASKKIKSIEQNTKESSNERDSMQLQLETLKREIAASLHDRDKAIKECNELRERFGAKDDSNKEWEHSYKKDYDGYKQERDMTLKENSDMVSSSHEMYSKAQKERLDNLDQANQEIDRLRKTIEKLQSDLEEAKREAEVSKRRRDWAFSERDKIVLERESIRAHCDKLRHERDRAVSELADALRDSDDMMKQRNEASKKLKELKEKLEAEQEKSAAMRHLVNHNSSRDSAIDTEMHEWETETLQMQTGFISDRDIGFEICGGADDPHYGSNDGAVFVSSVSKDGPFDGKLRLHDQLLSINGLECQGANRSVIYNAVLNGGGWVQITVRRRRRGGRTLHTTHLHCPHPAHHGLTLQTGVYIANILPGTPAAREGNLALGDRVLNVNGKPLENASGAEAQTLLDSVGEIIQLTTLKSVGSSSLSAPLSSSSSGHNMTEDEKSISSSRPYSSPTSPSKEIYSTNTARLGSRELALKINRGGVQISDEGGRRLGSSERVVYNVTKATEEKGSGGPWGQFKNIVKPRRHSKERWEGRSESREKEDKKKHLMLNNDPERDSALAQLDSVIDTYHYKTSSNGSNTGTTKRSKKKDKEKSGGTWPKSRGGLLTFSEMSSGTIKTPHWRKERPPLSMYLPTSSSGSDYKSDMKVYDSCQSKPNISPRMNSTSSSRGSLVNPRPQVFSIYKSNDTSEYKLNENYSNPHVSTSIYSTNLYQTPQGYAIPRSSSTDHKSSDVDKEKDHHSSPDTSIDFSVRSGNVGKEELEYYVKKNRVKYPLSDSESNLLPLDVSSHQPSSLPPVYLSRQSPLHPIGERIPSNNRIPHSHAGLYSPPSAALRVTPAFTPYSPLSFQLQHPHSHPHTLVGAITSYSSPHYTTPPLLSRGSPHFLSPSRSGDSILSSPGPDRDPTDPRSCYEHQISSSPTSSFAGGVLFGSGGGFYHSASPSIDSGGGLHKNRALHTHTVRASSDEPPNLVHHSGGPPSYHDYQKSIATIPRRKEDLSMRIPSNTIVMSKNNGTRNGFMERGCERNLERESPMPVNFSITQIHHSVHNQRFPSCSPQRKPQPGDIRNIYIEKESEPLGIRIKCLESGGVYVSSVTLNSLAAQVGLCIGDQLLEVCGINMRSATKEVASTVLSQCGSSVTMLVQFNPEKYHESEGWDESSSGGSIAMGSRSGTPTPQNSPKATRSSPLGAENDDEDLPPSSSSTLRAPLDTREALELAIDHSLPPSARSTLTRPQTTHILQVLKRQDTFSRRSNNSDNSISSSECSKNKTSNTDPRIVYLEMSKCHNLGIQMVGGNSRGIFIHSVIPDSPAAKADLRVGDRILKYNNVKLEHSTAERAAFELAKPADNVTMLVQWDFQTYSDIKDQPGDSFYVRALFDKFEQNDATELQVHKDDILYVDNTMFNNMPGQWRAWIVDEDGNKRKCGTIPSKDKVEEEMLSQRNMGDLPIDSTRRGSTSARRSFFKRKKHSRSSSRDSKELASFSDASLNSYTEAVPLADEPMPISYLRVERLDSLVRRPVVMVGPLWELVCDKLVQDFPHKYRRCIPEIKHCSQTEMELGIQNHAVVDYRRRGSHYEATLVSQVKEIGDKSYHGILDISLGSVERLHQHNIYPIVLMLKFKHHRHIREISDAHLSSHERLSQKEAKEMYDITSKLEQEYKHLVSAVITTGVNMAYICTQVKTLVDTEQSKKLWVPAGPL